MLNEAKIDKMDGYFIKQNAHNMEKADMMFHLEFWWHHQSNFRVIV